MTGEATYERWSVRALTSTCEQILRAYGLSDQDATTVAATLVDAELRGLATHGVIRVTEYCQSLTDGVDPAGRPSVVSRHGSTATIDADNSLGPVGLMAGVQLARELAMEHGSAIVAVRNSNHAGALGYYAEQIVSDDQVGIVISGAPPTMAPWGGRDRLLGNNPIAIGVPGGETPLIFDAGFSKSFAARERERLAHGAGLSPDVLLDANGRPTADPEAITTGTFRPVGDAQGSGLALALGLMVGPLIGAGFGTSMLDETGRRQAGSNGHLVLVIDPTVMGDRVWFHAEVAGILHQVQTSATAEGYNEVRIPGERGARRREVALRDGVDLLDSTAKGLRGHTATLGLPSPPKKPTVLVPPAQSSYRPSPVEGAAQDGEPSSRDFGPASSAYRQEFATTAMVDTSLPSQPARPSRPTDQDGRTPYEQTEQVPQ